MSAKITKAISDAQKQAAGEQNHQPTCKDAADWLKEPDQPDDPLIDGLIECGSLVAIVGPAKAAKSFLALHIAAVIATGRELFGRKTKRQRVYYANVEVSAKQCKKRLRAICDALQITDNELRGWLKIDNLRGETATWARCYEEAKRSKAEVVIIDPFYQVFKGKENDEGDCQQAVEEMKKYLAAPYSLFVVFHAPKGYSGDRQVVDMISGSSVLVRFPENVVAILPHATDKMARVIDCGVLRDYPPPDPVSVKFDKGALVLAPEIEPALATGRGIRQPSKSKAEKDAEKVKEQNEQKAKLDAALKRYLDKRGDDLPGATDLTDELRRTFPKNDVEDFIRIKVGKGELEKTHEMRWDDKAKAWKKVGSGQRGKTFISTPERIAAYKKKTSELPIA